MANCFASSDVAKAWTLMAEKELEGVEMIEASRFKDVLQERFKLLANETLRLCGFNPEEWRAEKERAQTVVLLKPKSVVSIQSEDVLDVFTTI